MPSEANKKAVIYCRTNGRDPKHVSSINAQQNACLDHCKANGLEVVETFEEVASGTDIFDERVVLHEAIRALETRGASVLVVSEMSRVSRNVLDAKKAFAAVKSVGARVDAVNIGALDCVILELAGIGELHHPFLFQWESLLLEMEKATPRPMENLTVPTYRVTKAIEVDLALLCCMGDILSIKTSKVRASSSGGWWKGDFRYQSKDGKTQISSSFNGESPGGAIVQVLRRIFGLVCGGALPLRNHPNKNAYELRWSGLLTTIKGARESFFEP